jgi:bifunctional non-homologous end joining protein LigD
VADSLTAYRRKRDFAASPEPKPKQGGRARRRPKGPRFVVQEHHARRLHWDLRLEHDGALASWAVPNGIPEAPDENHLAVRTEDHPLEYLEFHGEIPAGQYGAGTMEIWDSGTYELEKWEPRKVMVTFHGERLQGRYALFQTRGSDWMIHRMDPPADAGREPMPEHVVPMLARLAQPPPEGGGWAYEIKWDGVRAIAHLQPGRLRLESRNLNDITAQYPEVKGLTRAVGAHETLLDGELVSFDEQGRPSFGRLQQRMHLTSDSVIRRRMKTHPVTYLIFDLLHLDGHSLLDRPYRERREALTELGLDGPHWQTPAHHTGGGRELLEASAAQGLEGLIAKRLDSRYEPGKRPGTWLKVKNTASQEFVIGGWEPGEGRRKDRIGALLCGYYEREGGRLKLRFAGKVGTGFKEKDLVGLAARLRPLERKTSPFSGPGPARTAGKTAVFVKPELVAEVEFTEWTSEGLLRHPSFKGLRDDKDPKEVVRERPVEAVAPSDEGASPLAAARPLPKGRVEVTVEGRELRLSNLGKVLYPETGFNKGELIDYYARLAHVLLPHLHGRPLTLRRYPDGVEGPKFWEKRCPSHRPDWVSTTPIWSDRHKREIDYCLVNDLPSLLWIANLADIELHVSLSTAEARDRPTVVAFDLDPGEPADILDCCQVGIWVRGMLAELGLTTYAKTSGSKGLQVYVPLNTGVTYEQTKPFARAVAETLEKQFPDRVVSKMAKDQRKGKVLVDWSQNDEHKSTVCGYSLRARARPTVSTPVRWDEVESALEEGRAEGLDFDHEAALCRVAEQGDLFAGVLSEQQSLPPLEA